MHWNGSTKTKVIRRLKQAWNAGMNDRKAATYAGIDVHDLQELLRLDTRLEMQRAAIVAKNLETEVVARTNIRNSVKEGSVDTSRWYLERVAPDEFSSKSKVAVQADDFMTIQDKKAELAKLMEKYGE